MIICAQMLVPKGLRHNSASPHISFSAVAFCQRHQGRAQSCFLQPSVSQWEPVWDRDGYGPRVERVWNAMSQAFLLSLGKQ